MPQAKRPAKPKRADDGAEEAKRSGKRSKGSPVQLLGAVLVACAAATFGVVWAKGGGASDGSSAVDPESLTREDAKPKASTPKIKAETAAVNQRALQRMHDEEVQAANRKMREECGDPRQGGGPCQKHRADGQRLLALDVTVSDRLPLSRTLPDARSAACHRDVGTYKSAGTVSVVVVFFNEATSTLLRTAQSLLDRTASDSLLEILLVSDGPTDAPWGKKQRKEIKAYCEEHPKVRHLRLPQHLGLAPAKAQGAKQASGDLLVFLDSHCEVNTGWLEPLADCVGRDRKCVAIPLIDGVTADSFRYAPGAGQTRGVFTWGMYYAGGQFNKNETAQLRDGRATPMPIMPGGLFLIDRKYFEELGYYDEGLRIWGAENIELSLKVWRCGGRVELVPCSRVGHIFKSVEHVFRSGESLHKNFKRIAEVWLDDYKEFYYKSFPYASILDAGDLSESRLAKERLECKSMDWFLENVYPEMFVPKNVEHQGLLKNSNNGCLDLDRVEIASNPMQNPHVSPVAVYKQCSVMSDHNQWYFMRDTQRLIHIGIWTEECLGLKTDHLSKKKLPKKVQAVACQCAMYPGSGCSDTEIRWEYSEGQMKHVATGLCLTADASGSVFATAACNHEDRAMRWDFKDRWR